MKMPELNIASIPLTVTITVTGKKRHAVRVWMLMGFLKLWSLVGWALRVRLDAKLDLKAA